MDNNDRPVQPLTLKDSKIFKIIIIIQFLIILALAGFVIKISTEVSEIKANVKYVAEEFAFQIALSSGEGCGYDDPASELDKYTTDSSSSSTENENKSSDNSGQ